MNACWEIILYRQEIKAYGLGAKHILGRKKEGGMGLILVYDLTTTVF